VTAGDLWDVMTFDDFSGDLMTFDDELLTSFDSTNWQNSSVSDSWLQYKLADDRALVIGRLSECIEHHRGSFLR